MQVVEARAKANQVQSSRAQRREATPPRQWRLPRPPPGLAGWLPEGQGAGAEFRARVDLGWRESELKA